MITRHYVDVGGRRVHYRRSGSGPPVMLLHESPRSSAALLPLLERLGDGVTAFAFDTPGYGQSEKLGLTTPDMPDYADGLRATSAALGIARAPVYGTHTGAAIAYTFAVRHPDACALALLDGFPIFTPNEREEALANYLPPFRPAVDGTHLAWLWSRVRDQMLFFPWYRRGESARLPKPLPPPEALQLIAMDLLRTGDLYRSAYGPAFASRPLEQLADLRARVVMGARLDDVLLEHLERLPTTLPEVVTVDRFPADRDAWGVSMRDHLRKFAEGAAPPLAQATLPMDRVGCAYVDLPDGQMHLRGSLGGGGVPLLLLHPLPGSSVWFADVMERIAGRRPVIAPDLPGAGDSDTLDSTSGHAVVDALDTMLDRLGLREVEIAGEGTGALLARAMQHRDPTHRALGELTDVPVANATPPDFASFTPHPVGAHLFAAWHHVRDAAIFGSWTCRIPRPYGGLDAKMLHARTVDLLKARANHSALVAALLAGA